MYVCGYGRIGRGDTGDEYAKTGGEDYRTGVSYNAKRHLERIRLLLNSAMFRVHGLPSEHHCKGLLQRSGIWSIQSLYCSQQVELY